MKRFATALCLALWLCLPAGAEVFPFDYTETKLDNGLTVIILPRDTPDTVALQMVMRVGSRNEVEPGRSGFAHFFEHLMFRGTPRFPPEKAQDMLKRAGVAGNAWTWDDQTTYHKVFTKGDLEQILDYEADRFQNLQFSPEDFKTESLAVLGEYNKNSSNPTEKMYEVLQAKAFDKHTYEHTTMGFLEDIKNFPNLYDYSQTFFARYYRPEYAVLVLVGDLEVEPTLTLVKKYFGPWKAGDYAPTIPTEPAQTAPREASIAWDSPTLPWLMVGYKSPPFSNLRQTAAMQVIEALAFSENSALYKKLMLDDQSVDKFEPFFWQKRDPFLVGMAVRVKDPARFDEVRNEVLAAFEGLPKLEVSQPKLEAVKSRLKYEYALSLDSPQAIATSLAWFVSLEPDPQIINRYYQAVEDLTLQDLQEVASQHFVPAQRTVVTLKEKKS
ncbi:MAG: insulinase family protein [Candidatus Eremiobacteraeota bacterium]|nr:insulinase family protein [Candidatus Eremiobacteraeota bacterium]